MNTNKFVTFSIPRKDRDKFKEFCENHGVSMSRGFGILTSEIIENYDREKPTTTINNRF